MIWVWVDKTYIGSEKLKELNAPYNLVICQKSKLDDWLHHFKTNYPNYNSFIYKKQEITPNSIVIINYDSVWRRPELAQLKDFTLMLDESQYIKTPKTQRTEFITKKLKPTNIILLSGTPTGGKYEELITQCNLLGWKISKTKYYEKYIITKKIDIGQPYMIDLVVGYKNIDDLKEQLRNYGAVFKLTEECLTLPEQIESIVKVDTIKEYKQYKRDSIVHIENTNLVGENPLTRLLHLRQLAGLYNINKIFTLEELLESTDDRVVIFYNFREEYTRLSILCKQINRPISYVNGDGRNLKNYENEKNSITLVQYQSGASGINLQKANKIIYYSLPLSGEMYMQSLKRIHRIGQSNTCFYYYLITKNSIEEDIYNTLQQRQDYTLELFNKGGG